MQLLPIEADPTRNAAFAAQPACREILQVRPAYYEKVGFVEPWIGYFVADEAGELLGFAGYKGPPAGGRVEIDYPTFPSHQGRGVATEICRELVAQARRTDPAVRITARALPEFNFSTQVLRRNGFVLRGPVQDPDDGEVWEWEYRAP